MIVVNKSWEAEPLVALLRSTNGRPNYSGAPNPESRWSDAVETTHGVIRLCIPSPRFLYVSGIANWLGYFNCRRVPMRRTSQHLTMPE
jgi:hypothetical protein